MYKTKEQNEVSLSKEYKNCHRDHRGDTEIHREKNEMEKLRMADFRNKLN